MEPGYTIARYQLAWDGSRLCWPTSNGYWKRAITDNLTPKVWAPPLERGLLGAHLLSPAVDGMVVISEGDYAAASIPLPWVGVAIGGTQLGEHQIKVLLHSGVRAVTLCFDGDAGCAVGKARSYLQSEGIEVRVARGLREKQGPDDVSVPQRMDMLLEAR